MQLIYRGIRYNQTNHTEVVSTPENPSLQLTYRGIRYNPTDYAAMAHSASIQKATRYQGDVVLGYASHSRVSFNFKLRFLGATYNKTVFC